MGNLQISVNVECIRLLQGAHVEGGNVSVQLYAQSDQLMVDTLAWELKENNVNRT